MLIFFFDSMLLHKFKKYNLNIALLCALRERVSRFALKLVCLGRSAVETVIVSRMIERALNRVSLCSLCLAIRVDSTCSTGQEVSQPTIT